MNLLTHWAETCPTWLFVLAIFVAAVVIAFAADRLMKYFDLDEQAKRNIAKKRKLEAKERTELLKRRNRFTEEQRWWNERSQKGFTAPTTSRDFK